MGHAGGQDSLGGIRARPRVRAVVRSGIRVVQQGRAAGDDDGQNNLVRPPARRGASSRTIWHSRGIARPREGSPRSEQPRLAYQYGRGCEQSYDHAFAWYSKAAQRCVRTRSNSLGGAYRHGQGREQSAEQAFAGYSIWPRSKARNADSQNKLGWHTSTAGASGRTIRHSRGSKAAHQARITASITSGWHTSTAEGAAVGPGIRVVQQGRAAGQRSRPVQPRGHTNGWGASDRTIAA